jgi:hypothetical protein
MAGSLLQSFVSGTRQMLTAQLIVSVGAVSLAGWTLGVTNELIRERDRLRDRVIQLEQTMGGSGIVVPETPTFVDEVAAVPADTDYPEAVDVTEVEEDGAETADPAQRDPVPGAAEPTPGQSADAPAATEPRAEQPDIGAILGSLFAPPPPLQTVVLHVRSEADRDEAIRVARELMAGGQVRVLVNVMPPRDPRQSGYAYYDGRQSRAAAAMVSRFHDISRQHQVAPWSAQLRGIALPSQGDYTAERLDLVLPPLPEANLQLQRIDPRALQRQSTAPTRVN